MPNRNGRFVHAYTMQFSTTQKPKAQLASGEHVFTPCMLCWQRVYSIYIERVVVAPTIL